MDKFRMGIFFMLIVVLLFSSGCGGGGSTSTLGNLTGINSVTDTNSPTDTSSTSQGVTIVAPTASSAPEGLINTIGADADDMAENATFSNIVRIMFAANSATITNPLAGNGVEIVQNNGYVTVTSTVSEVSYEVSGTVTDGTVKFYSDKKFKLTLSGANITSTTGPAINIQSKKTIFVILEGLNRLTDAPVYSGITDGEDAKGAFFSEGQLVFSGSGTLTVAGKYKHGIISDDYIRIREGNIYVTEAIKDAIHAGDYIIIDGGTIDVVAGSDGIDCEKGYIIINDGNIKANVVDDGIVASYDIADETEPDATVTPDVIINGGTFDIDASTGEGIESKGIMTINDGLIDINAVDDAINTGGNLYINGGQIYANSKGNDSIDSNSTTTVTGGMVIAIGTREPEGSFDSDGEQFKITGGTLLGLAGTTSMPTAAVCTQNSVIFSGAQIGSLLHIQSEDKQEALTYQMPSTFTTVFYSSGKLSDGKKYYIYSGGSVVGGSQFNNLYTSGSYSGDVESLYSFTVNDRVTGIGGMIGPNGEPTDEGFIPAQVILPDGTLDGGATPPGGNIPPEGLPPESLPPEGIPPEGLPPEGLPPERIPPEELPPVIETPADVVTL